VPPDIDAVTRLIHQVSQHIIMPRFRTLREADVTSKASEGDLEDIVTVADQEAEAVLTEGLRAVLDVPVIGEEATAADASLVGLLDDEGPRWVVDPLDGTKNFAAGNTGFGVMVAYVERRTVRAAWVHLPARQETFVAEDGAGARLNGAPLSVAASEPDALRGSVFVRFMPPAEREAFVARVTPHVQPAASSGAAAVEYTDVLRGRKDLVVYYRLLPWDHGAPALILREAGGAVEHLSGHPYTIASKSQVTILARSAEIAARVRAWAGATS
jgi:fructose-1,6-bisphosphatase/inositol monophosphatase family enzyme